MPFRNPSSSVAENSAQVENSGGIMGALLSLIKDRVGDPLLSIFFLTFLLWNYDHFLLLIFSDHTIEQKVENFKCGIYHLLPFLGPILITAFYLFLYPFIKNEIVKVAEHFKLKIVQTIREKRSESITKYKEFLTIQSSWNRKKEILETENALFKDSFF
ncbi:MAG: hypothetical protein ABUK01_01075 [Leptospirales bacterium]